MHTCAHAPHRRPGAAGVEDGTLPFTSIAAARHGFALLGRLGGMPAVHAHTACLARHVAASLLRLRHANGAAAVRVYGWEAMQPRDQQRGSGALHGTSSGSSDESRAPPRLARSTQRTSASAAAPAAAAAAALQGPTVAFSLLRDDGAYVGYAEVARLAAAHRLHLRTGCFCNPGACAAHLGLSARQLVEHFEAGEWLGDT